MTPEYIRLLDQAIVELERYEKIREWAKDYTPQTRTEYARINAFINRCRAYVNAYHNQDGAAQGHA